jgi:hypothetical protein
MPPSFNIQLSRAGVLICAFSLVFLLRESVVLPTSIIPFDDDGITSRPTIIVQSSPNYNKFRFNVSIPCNELMARYGFWDQRQCDLWRFVENGTTIDMGPYLADNVPTEERWWNMNTTNSSSSSNHRLISHLHLHKCAGTFFCELFQKANHTQIKMAPGRSLASLKSNCNVPEKWWFNKSQPRLSFQYGSYMGIGRDAMKTIYEHIKQEGWLFVANEGSLEAEPLFGAASPYLHSTVLRDPASWMVSMWHYDDKHAGRKHSTFEIYLKHHFWGGPDFFTRRLCGVHCVLKQPKQLLTVQDFLRAKSMLQHFDLVLPMEDMTRNTTTTAQIFRHHFPAFEFQWEGRRMGRRSYRRKPRRMTESELSLLRDNILMDTVLYEYAKLLHEQQIEQIIKTDWIYTTVQTDWLNVY